MKNLHKIRPNLTEQQISQIWYWQTVGRYNVKLIKDKIYYRWGDHGRWEYGLMAQDIKYIMDRWIEAGKPIMQIRNK